MSKFEVRDKNNLEFNPQTNNKNKNPDQKTIYLNIIAPYQYILQEILQVRDGETVEVGVGLVHLNGVYLNIVGKSLTGSDLIVGLYRISGLFGYPVSGT